MTLDRLGMAGKVEAMQKWTQASLTGACRAPLWWQWSPKEMAVWLDQALSNLV